MTLLPALPEVGLPPFGAVVGDLPVGAAAGSAAMAPTAPTTASVASIASALSAASDDLQSWLVTLAPVLFYVAVWGLVFAGTALFLGIFIPFITGDSLLFAAGIAVALHPEQLNIGVLAVGVGVAAFLGDQVGFVLGRRLGRPYLARRRGRFIQAAIARTERFYELFGWWSVVIGRYIPWGRVLIPPIAGIGGMRYLRFVTANAVGAVTWGVLITVVGWLAAIHPPLRPVAYIVAGVVIAASILAGVRAWMRDRRARRAEVSAA